MSLDEVFSDIGNNQGQVLSAIIDYSRYHKNWI